MHQLARADKDTRADRALARAAEPEEVDLILELALAIVASQQEEAQEWVACRWEVRLPVWAEEVDSLWAAPEAQEEWAAPEGEDHLSSRTRSVAAAAISNSSTMTKGSTRTMAAVAVNPMTWVVVQAMDHPLDKAMDHRPPASSNRRCTSVLQGNKALQPLLGRPLA